MWNSSNPKGNFSCYAFIMNKKVLYICVPRSAIVPPAYAPKQSQKIVVVVVSSSSSSSSSSRSSVVVAGGVKLIAFTGLGAIACYDSNMVYHSSRFY